ncbi:MAG TPA: hypothetical protein PK659_10570 [Methanothrix sp.]|nr:hypothetical protein [Methanothrix sp.]HOK59318.1 hypothetical protein [Methanothrix sp.]HOL44686.1 hypothetical protein [Methanothrix sp.]
MGFAEAIIMGIAVYLWIRWVRHRRSNDIRMIEVTLPDESFDVRALPAREVD